MKNTLVDLQNHLFEQMEWMMDRDIDDAALEKEIRRGLALNEMAKTAVANGALIAKCFDTLSGIDDIPDGLPLIPLTNKGKKHVIAENNNKRLLDFPKVAMG